MRSSRVVESERDVVRLVRHWNRWTTNNIREAASTQLQDYSKLEVLYNPTPGGVGATEVRRMVRDIMLRGNYVYDP